ncbi:AraC family transcriptional regulator [Parabacteroides faecis]|uniref:AraC family transcriptional regulator n=1 Tax=Parabacteroides faecis TaxID=1217282 RepID=UPI0021646AA8|nr:helix-turn-helix domain-containing protein [Parabacteroides faecis]UVQ46297.1 AraC family transcriptional regulator [Parabacteroides faecis]
MKHKNLFKYLVSSEKDLLWGLIVDNVGHAEIPPNYEVYPPKVGHPVDYDFNPQNGRILDNYQLVYISKGSGTYFKSKDENLSISAGDMLIIPPYTWHSYFPDKKNGWEEYWIGMRGPHLDARFKNGFFSAERLVYNVGLQEEIISLYNQAIELALLEQSTYQQLLAGIGNLILGMALYYDNNQHFANDTMIKYIDQARVIMRENYLTNMSPQEVAQQINMGYSWFRKKFKEYTNVSPAHFMLELKLNKAKGLLLNTPLSVKEISYAIGYEDAAYFTALFKKYTGFTPLAYREQFSSNEMQKS